MEKQEKFLELISELSQEHEIEETTVYFIIMHALIQLGVITDVKPNEKEIISIGELYKVGDNLIKKLDK